MPLPKLGYVTVSFRVPEEAWEGVTKMTLGEALEVVDDLCLTKGYPILRREEAPSEGSIFIHCIDAGKRLYDKLFNDGFDIVDVGVGVDGNFKNRVISLTAGSELSPGSVPMEFEGFEVTVTVREPGATKDYRSTSKFSG